jgi:hypothetical protein
VDEAKEDVLGADVVVIEHACFFLSQDNNASGSIGKALKHGQGSFFSFLTCNYFYLWQAYNPTQGRREVDG